MCVHAYVCMCVGASVAARKPCFVEVIRCSNLERWGAKISRVMKCKTSETWTYDLLRNKRYHSLKYSLPMIEKKIVESIVEKRYVSGVTSTTCKINLRLI